MAKEIDKIIQSKTAPKSNNVLWDDGENLKINRNGKWEGVVKGAFANVTYAELVKLRDNGELIAGMQYCITDYVTTTVQGNTRSAGHQFDVIVTADNENTLNEVARTCLHDGDTYFSEHGAKLEAWQIWYSLDNDTERFGWADIENGKGVIYRMIDEWNNDIPYDFKNIIYVKKAGFKYSQWGNEYLFMRNSALDKVIDGTQYYGYMSEIIPSAWSEGKCWFTDAIINADSQMYNEDGSVISYGGSINDIVTIDNEHYTFRKDNEDDSLYGIAKDNVVKAGLKNGIQLLNNNIFGTGCYSNRLEHNSFNNTFGDNCHYNTLLGGFIEEYGRIYYCENNSFGNGSSLNVLGYVSFNNTFGENFNYNSFGNKCNNNTFGHNCDNNSFGNGCYNNNFGNVCTFNTIGNGCNSNSVGEACNLNNFDHNVSGIELMMHSTIRKTISVNSNGEAKIYNLADLADLLNQ